MVVEAIGVTARAELSGGVADTIVTLSATAGNAIVRAQEAAASGKPAKRKASPKSDALLAEVHAAATHKASPDHWCDVSEVYRLYGRPIPVGSERQSLSSRIARDLDSYCVETGRRADASRRFVSGHKSKIWRASAVTAWLDARGAAMIERFGRAVPAWMQTGASVRCIDPNWTELGVAVADGPLAGEVFRVQGHVWLGKWYLSLRGLDGYYSADAFGPVRDMHGMRGVSIRDLMAGRAA
jgi:hypothetical protein